MGRVTLALDQIHLLGRASAHYAPPVPIDPSEERRRIEVRYAAARPRDLVVLVMAAAAVFLASRFWDVDWWVFVGALAAFVGWEITKLRLRRNARDFSRSR